MMLLCFNRGCLSDLGDCICQGAIYRKCRNTVCMQNTKMHDQRSEIGADKKYGQEDSIFPCLRGEVPEGAYSNVVRRSSSSMVKFRFLSWACDEILAPLLRWRCRQISFPAFQNVLLCMLEMYDFVGEERGEVDSFFLYFYFYDWTIEDQWRKRD